MNSITQLSLKTHLHYSPDSGEFTWIAPNPHARRIRVGDRAGRSLKSRYIQIGISGKYYLAHRLAFLYMTGKFPHKTVDHINGDPSDNRWKNLREVTNQDNSRNSAKSLRNTSGVIGVTWNAGVNKWIANICGKHIGCYADYQEAVDARKAAETTHNFHLNHGRSK